ncbi:hypothetical protein DID88_009116 [Monilinia fructigena]|uniref:Uncharacterized protein n=1 Tax=Monilinia fructigena TaxID=38457 RepID=A0A395IF30_9HELO|nr:hypothetical protein DID88_009116 [Monilinia fructigena]
MGKDTLLNTVGCSLALITPTPVTSTTATPTLVPAAIESKTSISLWEEAPKKLFKDPELGRLVHDYERDLWEQHQSNTGNHEQKGDSNVKSLLVDDVDSTAALQRAILEN